MSKRILSVDGGGMKGYLPCAMLVELERQAGRPVSEMFDMIAGTSIGGILACLFATGSTATEAMKFFTSDGPVIFGSQQLMSCNGVFRPRYAAGPLETCLQNRFGKLTLADCKAQLLVPAFDLVAYEPYFFKSGTADTNYPLWQVARATSAAQTYFPAYDVGNHVFWDGGNVANNPAACAVAEAYKLWGDEQLCVLSIGCGTASSKVDPQNIINAGIARIGTETMGLLFDANDELPDYLLKQLLDEQHYFRAQPNPTVDLAIDGADPAALNQLQLEAQLFVQNSAGLIKSFLACTS